MKGNPRGMRLKSGKDGLNRHFVMSMIVDDF
jgi:hypothetical protein